MRDAQPNVYSSRRVSIPSGIRTKVLDYSITTIANWQAWIFSNDPLNKSTAMEFEFLSTYGSQGIIEFHIGGGNQGGGLLTGTGACEVYATGQGPNDISIWFVDEQRTISLPPKTLDITLGIVGSTQDIGYPPFGREYVDVKSTSNVKVNFKDDTGTIVLTTTLYLFAGAPVDYNLATQALTHYHPPNLTMELESTVVNQRIIITHATH
jgi:hypothetical protein